MEGNNREVIRNSLIYVGLTHHRQTSLADGSQKGEFVITVMTAMSELEEVNYCMNRLWNMLKPYLKHDRIEEIQNSIFNRNRECAVILSNLSAVQKTKCAICGELKETPLRRDELGGYVCLSCIDKYLDSVKTKTGTCNWVKIGKQNYTTSCAREVAGWEPNDNGEIDFCDSCGGQIKIV